MAKQKALTDREGEVRELEQEDFSKALPLSKLSASLRRKVGGRGPQKAPTKEKVTIRLSRDVVEAYRATGPGWQSRMDEDLSVRYRNKVVSNLERMLEEEADPVSRIRLAKREFERDLFAHSGVWERIEQAAAAADHGDVKNANMHLKAAIQAYLQGKYAA